VNQTEEIRHTAIAAIDRSDLEVAIEHAKELCDIDIIDDDAERQLAAVLPSGKTLHSLAAFREELRREEEAQRTKDLRRGTARLLRVESLIEHIARHKDSHTVIYADNGGIQAIYDYNESGGHDDGKSRPCKHRASWSYPISLEWRAWQTAETAGFMDQETFAGLLQRRLADIIDPHEASEDILELAIRHGVILGERRRIVELGEGLSIRVTQDVASHVRVSSGETQMVFQTDHKDEKGEPLDIPSGFLIAIPVFEGEDAYTMPARLSYRVKSGTVKWAVALANRDEVFRDAVDIACQKVREAFADIPFFYGTPER
jgi:hypothetical protein